jgi:hypothetical protein
MTAQLGLASLFDHSKGPHSLARFGYLEVPTKSPGELHKEWGLLQRKSNPN